jgi:hypothetical protein
MMKCDAISGGAAWPLFFYLYMAVHLVHSTSWRAAGSRWRGARTKEIWDMNTDLILNGEICVHRAEY